jgi:cystathionine beta-lyase/cystathionine gamma-synthase
VSAEARPSAGLLRLSVGLEDVDDLAADLAQALGAAGEQSATTGQRVGVPVG